MALTPRTPVFISPACIGPARATNPTQTALGSLLSAWKSGRGTFPGGVKRFRPQETSPSREHARRCCPVSRAERIAPPLHPTLRTCSGTDGWFKCVVVRVCRVRATAEVEGKTSSTETRIAAATTIATPNSSSSLGVRPCTGTTHRSPLLIQSPSMSNRSLGRRHDYRFPTLACTSRFSLLVWLFWMRK